MADAGTYPRGLLSPVGRKTAGGSLSSQVLAEFAGHSMSDGLQRVLNRACWGAEELRNDVQAYVAGSLGDEDGVLIIDDTGFVKKGVTSFQATKNECGLDQYEVRQYPGWYRQVTPGKNASAPPRRYARRWRRHAAAHMGPARTPRPRTMVPHHMCS
ncbi:transposase [Streptomyces sp. NPDC088116]|uniref:transposase n=1 Tax=Streptomyces sp. NPDC088116 TaxID=3365825 RepID=UPI00381A6EA4